MNLNTKLSNITSRTPARKKRLRQRLRMNFVITDEIWTKALDTLDFFKDEKKIDETKTNSMPDLDKYKTASSVQMDWVTDDNKPEEKEEEEW